MYKATVNEKHHFTIEPGKEPKINGQAVSFDVIQPSANHFHILKGTQSFTAEVLETLYEEKSFVILVNNNTYKINLKDKFDDLLKSLGMEVSAGSKINELKAPMPGLVVDVKVAEGQEIKKGDPVLVLEAMKMENILKSAADVTIKKINVKKGDKVEKNQVMVTFN